MTTLLAIVQHDAWAIGLGIAMFIILVLGGPYHATRIPNMTEAERNLLLTLSRVLNYQIPQHKAKILIETAEKAVRWERQPRLSQEDTKAVISPGCELPPAAQELKSEYFLTGHGSISDAALQRGLSRAQLDAPREYQDHMHKYTYNKENPTLSAWGVPLEIEQHIVSKAFQLYQEISAATGTHLDGLAARYGLRRHAAARWVPEADAHLAERLITHIMCKWPNIAQSDRKAQDSAISSIANTVHVADNSDTA